MRFAIAPADQPMNMYTTTIRSPWGLGFNDIIGVVSPVPSHAGDEINGKHGENDAEHLPRGELLTQHEEPDHR